MLTLQRFHPQFIFPFELLQLLSWFLLVGLFSPFFGSRGFAQSILRLANHQKLRIGILDKLRLQRQPSEVAELVSYADVKLAFSTIILRYI